PTVPLSTISPIFQKLRRRQPGKSLLRSQSVDKPTWRGWVESVENDPKRPCATTDLRVAKLAFDPIPLVANDAPTPASFNHFVGGREQRRRNGKAENPGGLGVDHELELCRLNDRKVSGLGASQDAAGIRPYLPIGIRNIATVAHHPADLGKLASRIYRRHPVSHCRKGQLEPPGVQERVLTDEQSVRSLARRGSEDRKGRIDLGAGAGSEDLNFQSGGAGNQPYFSQDRLRDGCICRIDEDCPSGCCGNELTQELQLLLSQLA